MAVLSRGLVLLLLATLTGCANFGSKRKADDPWVTYAEARVQDGDYNGAARIFSDMAGKSSQPDYYRLRGADAYLRGGNSSAAQALMTNIDPGELADSDRIDFYLLSARLNLNVGRARQAMSLLDQISRSRRDDSQELHYRLLRASGYNQLGRMLDSARERVSLAPSLKSADAVAKNNTAIFDALNRLPDSALTRQSPPPPNQLGGWMQLTHILRSAPVSDLGNQLGDWRQRYPNHPADGDFLDDVLRQSGRHVEIRPTAKPAAPVAPPEPRVAQSPSEGGRFVGVALPLTGSYAPAGEAIRAGMLAAFYADETLGKSALRFTDSQSASIEKVYKDFATQGAAMTVGPLLKEEVARVMQISERPIPVLALNQVSDRTDPAVVQFGLTPEQEVEQAAGAAWFDGRHQAAVLAPTSAFGERLASHFTRYWRSLGGRVVAAKTYAANTTDFSRPVQELTSLLGVRTETSDASNPTSPKADFLFLIANAHDARLLKPQLDTNGLASLPIYATSHVFSGRSDAQQDRDLDGIYFCDIPWLLHASQGGALSSAALSSEVEKTSADFVKLIALGIDAYRLAKEVPSLGSRFTGYLFDGATGMLTLQSGNRVQRQLECAQFEAGVPQPRGLAPILRASDPKNP